jgi:hypothetical protein
MTDFEFVDLLPRDDADQIDTKEPSKRHVS